MHTAEQHRRKQGAKLVSIIVVNYNGKAVVARCLDCLLAQNYPNFEIIAVDNNSTDGSRAMLERYAAKGVRVIRSATNSGGPGGRNLALPYAGGEILAFIDNDGYADRNWLSAAVGTLESDERIGAVASAVFFARRRTILNGCGGTINWQGYGGDLCFHAPYEFADIPREVLFPMACGAVVRADVFARMGQFDPLPLKWYEDVELGIWVWACGYKVVVAQEAWIDHVSGFSDAFLPSKIYMCERARIRTALKYYPARRLGAWLGRELTHLMSLGRDQRPLIIKAWMWNLAHLLSAWQWRRKIRPHKGSFWHLLDRSWGHYPPPVAENGALHPDPARWGSSLKFDGSIELAQLNFGWNAVERSSDGRPFRWTEAHASAFFKLPDGAQYCRLGFFSPLAGPKGQIIVRRAGTLQPLARFDLMASGTGWEQVFFPCRLTRGCYEVLIGIARPVKDDSGRIIGLPVSSITFE